MHYFVALFFSLIIRPKQRLRSFVTFQILHRQNLPSLVGLFLANNAPKAFFAPLCDIPVSTPPPPEFAFVSTLFFRANFAANAFFAEFCDIPPDTPPVLLFFFLAVQKI